MEVSNNNGKIIGALLAGAAIGGVIGIILAPRKGSKTQKKIIKKSLKIRDTAREKLNDFISEICKDAETITEIELIENDPQLWRS
ncbi:MAG: YtxH domain-containing protein [Flavobacteriaceae bacterium]|nr:YtxH domain-containing protein [Flavobacteriaceae bacterium]